MAHTKIFRCPSCKAKLPVFFDPRAGGAVTCACGTQIGLMDRRRGKREYRRMLEAKGLPIRPKSPNITATVHKGAVMGDWFIETGSIGLMVEYSASARLT